MREDGAYTGGNVGISGKTELEEVSLILIPVMGSKDK